MPQRPSSFSPRPPSWKKDPDVVLSFHLEKEGREPQTPKSCTHQGISLALILISGCPNDLNIGFGTGDANPELFQIRLGSGGRH